MRRSWVLCFVVSVVSVTLCPSSRARADDPPPVAMRDLARGEAPIAAIVSAAVLAASFASYPAPPAAWRGGVLFDDASREALQLRSPGDRQVAGAISDGLVGALVLAPAVVDAAIVAWLVRGDAALMGRLLLVELQALAIAHGIATIFKYATLRERPMVRACREDRARQEADPICESRPDPDIEPSSFFSGHATLAFTSAAVVCLHHTELGLFGPAGDATACATGLALAATVGLLRIAADRHYASDVLVGAAVGLLSGWLVPWLAHFDVADAIGLTGADATIAPMASERALGVQVLGVF